MRKMLNKKGFSLVELMIVVVIMGILIAVAIPLYGNITKNAKNNTCASNKDTIENAAVVYFTENGKAAEKIEDLKIDGGVPKCPWDKTKSYTATFNETTGSATVTCGAQSSHQA